MATKVLVLGGSGLLGRAVVAELKEQHGEWQVVGTAMSRTGPGLVKLDVGDKDAVRTLITTERPRVVVNCIAERRPDVVDKDPEKTNLLNVEAARAIAIATQEVGSWLLHLSTDYVFDGTAPPYKPSDPTNPLQNYGVSKLGSERVVREAQPDAGILRVPVLYGPAESLSESAALILAKDVVDSSKPKAVDAWSARFPTLTGDVAVVIRQLIERRLDVDTSFSGTWHWSSKEKSISGEPYTKYTIAKLMGEILRLPTDHLSPDPNPPKGAPRPRNCELDISYLESLGIGRQTPLKQGLEQVLPPLIDNK